MTVNKCDFSDFVATNELLLSEGSIYERLRRFPDLILDPEIANASLIYNPESAKVLRSIVQEYLQVGVKYKLPIFALTNTWRANKERIGKSKYAGKNVNLDSVNFYRALIDELNSETSMFLGGLMGCRGDAYKAEESLGADEAYEFHKWQAHELAKGEVDFLFASTLPAVKEARGLARAMAETKIPYIISFVIRANGTTLDGNLLRDAIKEIDDSAAEPPIRYMINCSHSSAFRAAYPSFSDVARRVGGLQANTSSRDPLELDGLAELETEEPSSFARAMKNLRRDFNLQILGGCCGTDTSHIDALARELKEAN